MKLRNVVLWLVAFLSLAFVNLLAYQRERLALDGQVVLLELVPVDPRSLIQGDYMQLRYAISEEIDANSPSVRGYVVVRLDANNIAHYVRIYDSQTPLADNELLLPYRRANFNVRVGPESFFFQEGHAEYYNNAEYGELRVSQSGQVLLVGLRGKGLEVLGPP